MKLARKAWTFLQKDFSTDLSYRLSFVLDLAFVMLMVASFYFFSRMFEGVAVPSLGAYGGAYFPFVLVGLAFSSYLNVAVRSFSENIRSAQVLGTLEALLVTPTSPGQIVILSSVYDFLATSLRVILTVGVGMFLFDIRFPEAHWGLAFLVFALSVVSFSFLGIFSASVVLAFKRADPSSWLVQGLSYLLGGVYYPTSVLPEWAQWISSLLPITHALEAMRKVLLLGAGFGEIRASLLALVIFSAIAGPLSLWAFLAALKRVRQEGSLSHF